MEKQNIANGGVQYVPQIAVQYVYLDFDGELTSYNGEILTVENVEIKNSSLTKERIAHIVAELNAKYASQNVIFVTDRPTIAEYSTIFIGKTGAFAQYGNFAGLAETIDEGNKNSTDKAFVMLDSTNSNEAIISTISHETDHLLGTLSHGGSGLAAYAYEDEYHVSSGEISSGIELNYDSMYISSGGVANSTTVNNWGSMYISSGGVANDTAVEDGSMCIEDGGTANDTIVNVGGAMYISSGGVANDTIVNVEGAMYISSGGVANSTTVSDWGYMCISCGGIANGTTVSSEGAMRIFSGGVAGSTTINDGGRMYIDDGGVANSIVLNSGGSMYISSGGVANSIVLNHGGDMYIYAGGTATNILRTPWVGYVSAEDGAYVTYADNTYSGVYIVSAAEVMSESLTMTGKAVYDSMYVFSGGVVNSTTVNSHGGMYISSGGVANSTTVNFYGGMYISSGGVANRTTVNYNGFMFISSGGVANSTTLSGGYDDKSEFYYGNAVMYISSGGVVNDTTVKSYGKMRISNGGVANETTVDDGEMHISNGGVANSTTVNDCGYMSISFGGIANSTTINYGGYMYIEDGGVANSIVLNSGGYMCISSGGTATNILRTPWGGDVSAEDGAYVTYADNTYSGVYIVSAGEVMSESLTMTGKAVYDAMYVFSGGVAGSTTINYGGTMYISSGGVANDTTICQSGYVNVYSGGFVSGATVEKGGTMVVSSGGSATDVSGEFMLEYGGSYNGKIYSAPVMQSPWRDDCGFIVNSVCDGTRDEEYYNPFHDTVNAAVIYGINGFKEGCHIGTVIHSGAMLTTGEPDNCVTIFESAVVSSGGSMIANNSLITGLQIHRGGKVQITGGICDIYDGEAGVSGPNYVSYGIVSDVDIQGMFTLGSQAQLSNCEVKNGGLAYILANAEAEKVTVGSSGNLYIAMAGEAENVTVSGGSVHVATGGRIADVTVTEKGSLFLYGGSVIDGEINLQGTVTLDDLAVNNGKVNFVLGKNSAEAMINDLDLLSGGSYSVKVADALTGEYILAENASGFDQAITIENNSGTLGSLSVGNSILVDGDTYSLNKKGDSLILRAVVNTMVSGVAASASGVTWNVVGNASVYMVNCSQDDFAHSIAIETVTNALDTFGIPAGAYQYQVSADGESWSSPADVKVPAVTSPQKLVSNANGNTDLFFAEADGTWNVGYAAGHQGILNGWKGTKEQVKLNGKNKIADVFKGSSDANVLVLTDDSNGDALFVDDIYTSFGKDAARISQIDEIRAGAGDDIVDLTSQKFAYAGEGVKVYGGLGSDTIWANKGKNILFGDAGNDRIVGGSGYDVIIGGIGNDSMHGGGGEDIFTFGGNWGKDTITQLADGKVTLWFEDGDKSKWNSSTLTYTDGENSVKVMGIASDKISLKFGGDTSDLPDGAFAEAASEKIFEDKNKGMLA